jgi:hypothetical protein
MRILLTILLALFSLNSYACRCYGGMELEEIVASSESIFVAKVVSQKVAEENYTPGDLVRLDVRLRVLENLKGRTKRIYHAVGYEWSSSYDEDGNESITVGGCHHDVQEGDKYLVFYKKGRTIELDKCAEFTWGFWGKPSIQAVSEVKSILKRPGKENQPAPKNDSAD